MGLPKAAIAGTCLVILMAAIVGVVAYVVHQEDKKIIADAANTSTSHKAVQDVCQSTYYQETCIKSLSKYANSSDTHATVKAAFMLAVKEETSAAMKNSALLQKAPKDPGTAEAFKARQKLLSDSIDDLQRTADEHQTQRNKEELLVC